MDQAALLVEKIARVRRFADAMGSVADRERFGIMANELQRELDKLRAFPRWAVGG
jgi:hypothetical protein